MVGDLLLEAELELAVDDVLLAGELLLPLLLLLLPQPLMMRAPTAISATARGFVSVVIVSPSPERPTMNWTLLAVPPADGHRKKCTGKYAI